MIAPMDLLFRLLSGAAAARDVDQHAWPALLEEGESHRVVPLLAQRLLTQTVPEDVRTVLAARQEATARRNMGRLRDFAIVAAAFAERGIPVIALKGMHLTALVFRNLAARAMVDIDLLVPPEQLSAAGDALIEIGYAPIRPYGVRAGAVPSPSHQLPSFIKANASTVEPHWHLCDPGTTPRIDVAELWERAVAARIGGVQTCVLAVEDLLLHLTTHATYTDRCDISVRTCCDVAEIVRTQEISWPDVIERAGRWNVAGGAYLVLRLAREVFGTPIPPEVIAELRPPDFDERLLRIAMRGPVPRNPAAPVRYAAGVRGKVKALKDVLFPNLDSLASAYEVERTSPRIYLVPFRRALRLPARWREVAAVFRNETPVAESALMEAFLHGASK